MTTFTRRRAVQAIGGALAAPLLARTASADPANVRLAMIPIEPTCQAFYAQENGYFEKAGLNVDITLNPSSPGTAAALLSGTYDIAYASLPTLAVTHAKGVPFVIIAPAGIISPGLVIGAITVAANSPIKTAKDCNGKTFATSGLNTQGEYVPRAWVDKHGGDSTTIKFVELPFTETAAAIAAGRVDASYLVEPFLTLAVKQNLVRILAPGDDAIASTYLASAWYATASWAKANPDVVAHFATAMGAAARWANANPTKVVPIIEAHLKTDPAILAITTRTAYTDRLVDAQIQPWIDVAAKYAKFPPFPAADLIYRPGG
jgi:NitT/TauT family transport system substrate-binding protein